MMNSIDDQPQAIIIGARGLIEIEQNLRMLLTTLRGSVFLDRQFGMNSNLVDLPQTVVIAKLRNAIYQQVEQYEPRVQINRVDFKIDDHGELRPTIQFTLKPGVLI